MIAALYVEKDGAYFGLPDVDPWDEARDARKYAGPWPVVAHPPCQRWGRYWRAAPQPAVAAGWVMVPVEPTLEMLMDAARAYEQAAQSLGKHSAPWAAYRAMLSALPPVPSTEGESNG